MALEKAIGQADKETDSWVVPFFSLIVKDIYFLHQGMSDRDVKGFIRFEKCFSLARLVSQILSYKDRVVRAHTPDATSLHTWSTLFTINMSSVVAVSQSEEYIELPHDNPSAHR